MKISSCQVRYDTVINEFYEYFLDKLKLFKRDFHKLKQCVVKYQKVIKEEHEEEKRLMEETDSDEDSTEEGRSS